MATWKILFIIAISAIVILAFIMGIIVELDLDNRFKEIDNEIDKEKEKSEEEKRIRLARQN
jgi:uncharacterized protein YxeA